MKRLILLLAVLLVTPGCLAALAAGAMYAQGQKNLARGERDAARLEYISEQKAKGKTDAQILASIKTLDPTWYEEIMREPAPETMTDASKPYPVKK